MPLDKSGKFHGNVQRAMAADKNSAPPPKRKPGLMPVDPDPLTEVPAASPAMDHLRDLHAEAGGGKHMLVSRGEGGLTSHQIGDGGEPEGPHSHADVEELKAAMDEFFAEELAEPEMQQEY